MNYTHFIDLVCLRAVVDMFFIDLCSLMIVFVHNWLGIKKFPYRRQMNSLERVYTYVKSYDPFREP